MGIWGAVCYSADTLKRWGCCAYGAGGTAVGWIGTAVGGDATREVLHSAADKVRNGAPNLAKPVTGIVRSSYDLGLATALSVDQAVRVEGVRRIKESMPDRDGWVKIGRVAVNITDLALDKFTKPYTGGLPVYRAIKEGLLTGSGESHDQKAEEHSMERELQELRDRMERLEMAMSLANGSRIRSHSRHRDGGGGGVVHQKPEDVIRVFMMKGFKGGDFTADHQVVLHHHNRKNDMLLSPVL